MSARTLLVAVLAVVLAALGLLLWQPGVTRSGVGPDAKATSQRARASPPTNDVEATAGEGARVEVAAAGAEEVEDGRAAADDNTIHGRVVDGARNPVAGARVVVSYRRAEDFNVLDLAYAHRETQVGEARTEADGRFRIAVPPEWPLRVVASAPGYSSGRYDDVFAGAELELVLGPVTALIGRVTRKQDGSPVERATVRLFRYGGPTLGETRTLGDGSYALRDVPPGAAVIAVESDRLADPGWTDVDLPAGVQVIRDFALDEGFAVYGAVTDAATGAPIAGAEIGAGWTYRRSVRSESDGTYELRGFGGPGVHDIFVRAATYVDARHEFDWSAMPTERTRVDFALEPGFSVSGRILDPNGAALTGVYVAAVSPGGPDGIESWKSTESGGDGRFTVDSLSMQHQYALFLHAAGWANLAYAFHNPVDDTHMDVGDIVLQPAGSISGVVVDEQNRPRTDVTVVLSGSNADAGLLIHQLGEHPPPLPRNVEVRSVHAGPAGRFHFGEVAAGAYHVQARHRSGAHSDSVGVTLASGERRGDLRLVLASGARIFGRALTPQGEGLPGALVRLAADGSMEHGRFAHTGDGGRFEVLDLEPRPYALSIVPLGYEAGDEHPSIAVLSPVVPSENELVVTVAEAALLEGVVLGPDGTPSAGAYVSAEFEGLPLTGRFCDEEGAFVLPVPSDLPCDLTAYTTVAQTGSTPGRRIVSGGPKAEARGVVARGQRVELYLAE